MNHKNFRDMQLSAVLLIATLCVAFFTMAALSNFKLGLHFDKDMRVISEVSDHDAMREFSKLKQKQGYESDLVISSNDIAILNISGVENSEVFVKELMNAVPDTKILLLGSFGSITKFTNNQSFIAVSLLMICLVIVAYEISLNKMFGWYKSLEIILIAMTPLFIVNLYGYALSVNVWYGILSVFLIMLVLSENFTDRMSVRVFCSIVFIAMGVFLRLSNILRFQAVGLYWIFAGLISIGVCILYQWVFLPLLTPYRYSIGFERKKLVAGTQDGSYTKIKLLTAAILAVALSFVLSMARGQYDTKGDERGFYKELVISQSENTNYLEIQALLSRLGLFEEQLSYLVSEQGQTWIEFSSATTMDELHDAQVALMSEFQIQSVYFDGVPPHNYFNTQILNVIVAALAIGVGVYLLVSEGARHTLTYALELVVAMIVYICLNFLIKLQNNQVWLLGLVLLPLVQSILSIHFKGKRSGDDFINSLIMSAIVLTLVSLPVFVIVPSAVSAELIFYFIFLVGSAYFGTGLSILFERLEKGHADGTTTIKE